MEYQQKCLKLNRISNSSAEFMNSPDSLSQEIIIQSALYPTNIPNYKKDNNEDLSTTCFKTNSSKFKKQFKKPEWGSLIDQISSIAFPFVSFNYINIK